MDNPNDNKIVVKGDAGHGGEVRTSLSTPDGYRVKIDIRGRGDALIVIPSNFSGPRQQPRRRRGGGDNDDGNDEHGGGGSSIPSSSSSASKRIRVSSWCHGSVMGAICWGQETSAKCFDCCTVFWVAGLIRHVLPACGSAVAFGFDELFQTIVIYIYIYHTTCLLFDMPLQVLLVYHWSTFNCVFLNFISLFHVILCSQPWWDHSATLSFQSNHIAGSVLCAQKWCNLQ